MKLIGIGTDIVELKRFEAHAKALPDGPARRYLTESEMAEALIRRNAATEYLASRFAAKEAVMKSLGCGMDRVSFREVEISSAPDGRPFVRLSGRAQARASEISAAAVMISISHGKESAVAFAAAVAEDAL